MVVAVPVWRRVVSRCGWFADAEFEFASERASVGQSQRAKQFRYILHLGRDLG